jgi:hypothetical protein
MVSGNINSNRKWMQMKYLKCSLEEGYSSTHIKEVIITHIGSNKDNNSLMTVDKINKMTLII